MNTLAENLPNTLQQVRKARRLSQLELSMRVGVSQRHVSFVESGRAKPSRSLLITWLQELDAPLPLRNAAMLQAGYAPAYSAASLTDPALAQANDALVQLLNAHDPMPAFVLDADWNVLHMNRGARWFATHWCRARRCSRVCRSTCLIC
jgi:transcriptional regulator with XRE-family HTH domain